MLALINNFKKPGLVAIATILSCVIAFNANAQISDNNDISSINDSLDMDYDTKPTKNFDHLPEGRRFDYSYDHSSDGISLKAEHSNKYSLDWRNEYVNTSGSTVQLVNITSGKNEGISLGCDGLDLGLESLFEFEAGDILKYLPQFILTKFAVEALATIYATPLISTVMDGIKAMNNFVAEAKTASCNMSKVMDRSEEIKKEQIQKCLKSKLPPGTEPDSGVMSECENPDKLANWLKDKQKEMGSLKSSTSTLSEYFTKKTDIPYDNNQGEEMFSFNGASYTSGRLAKMFLPEVTFKTNGGGPEERKPAKLSAGSVYAKSKNHAFNAISSVYSDLKESMAEKNILSSKTQKDIIVSTQNYLNNIMMFGSKEVYTDSSGDLETKYTSDKIDLIKKRFETSYRVDFNTNKTSSGSDEFLIGPEDGPTSAGMSDKTSFSKGGIDILLKSGQTCFAKVYDSAKSDSKYSWRQVHMEPNAIFSIGESTDGTLEDTVIRKVSECKVLNTLNLPSLDLFMKKDSALGYAYMEKIATEAAYQATASINQSVIDTLVKVIETNDTALIEMCKKNGGHTAMEHTAVRDGNTNQAYNSCEEFSEQNKNTPEKLKAIEVDIENKRERVKLLKDQRDAAAKNFDMVYNITTNNDLN